MGPRRFRRRAQRPLSRILATESLVEIRATQASAADWAQDRVWERANSCRCNARQGRVLSERKGAIEG
eukprot:scaffold6505_cov134-Pinguiococcus_pyrenoidosus.AAC.1